MDKFLHGDAHKSSHGSNYSSGSDESDYESDGGSEFESTGIHFWHLNYIYESQGLFIKYYLPWCYFVMIQTIYV